jgi:MFS transporter, NHS family, xanthosine permease
MNFLQLFVWGSWLISLGAYLMGPLHFTGKEVGSIYATMGISALFMPSLVGMIADKWVNAERLLGLCHLLGAFLLYRASQITDPDSMYWIMLLNAMCYLPSLALNNTVSYILLERKGHGLVKVFPTIRVWGTVGFIAAVWLVDLCGWTKSPHQLYVSSAGSLFLGFYAFTMPQCPPSKIHNHGRFSILLSETVVLFKSKKLSVFFLFSLLIGVALQLTNAFGSAFLNDFASNYPNTFVVNHPNVLLSISQVSETLFILAIPFFLRKFGIKKVMLISIFAWVLRFALFAIGNPTDGLWLLISSMIIYGMAFDFFLVSGSLFVDKEVPRHIRANAQGLFIVMTNGLGSLVGGIGGGWIIDHFTSHGVKDWYSIWLCFAAYALLLGLVFPFAFNYQHTQEKPVAVRQ